MFYLLIKYIRCIFNWNLLKGVNQILTDGTYLVMEQTDPTLSAGVNNQRTSPQTVRIDWIWLLIYKLKID